MLRPLLDPLLALRRHINFPSLSAIEAVMDDQKSPVDRFDPRLADAGAANQYVGAAITLWINVPAQGRIEWNRFWIGHGSPPYDGMF
jgi:hypothetical protein